MPSTRTKDLVAYELQLATNETDKMALIKELATIMELSGVLRAVAMLEKEENDAQENKRMVLYP